MKHALPLAGTLLPETEGDVVEIVGAASAGRAPLRVAGGGTRSGLGRPVEAPAELSTRALTGITLYSRAELVISARAGTPLAEVERLLAENRQRLDFEPMDHRPLYGTAGEPTIGAVAAANVSGPRRVVSGAARDSLIGLRAVTGRGEIIKSGGRVMKNVTGYDLLKLFAGSHGTLGILTEVTFKVLPIPERELTVVLEGLDDRTAIAALSAALGTPFGVTGAAHRPARGISPARTFLRMEGLASSAASRADKLRTALAGWASADVIEAEGSAALWRDIRDLRPLEADADTPVWRVSVKPSDGPSVAETLQRAVPADILFDWGGGLLWIATGAEEEPAALIRATVTRFGGHATLARAPDEVRRRLPVFDPPEPAVDALSQGIKRTFDPAGILNPGRMYASV